MKRNLLFFSCLIVLLSFTYFFEEIGHVQKEKKQDEATRVLNFEVLGKLKSYKTPFVELLAREGGFETSSPRYYADSEKMDALFAVLSQIKVSRVLSEDEKKKLNEDLFFPKESLWFDLVLERGEVRLVVGKKLGIDRSFYIKMKRSDQKEENWALAYDDSPVEGVYTEDEEKTHNAKYDRLLQILNLKTEFFFDTHPLKGQASVLKLKVQNTRNRPFEVDDVSSQTIPPVVSGLRYSSSNFKTFIEEFYKLKAKKVELKPDFKKLQDSLAKIQFERKNSKPLTLELFKRYAGKEGYFVKSSSEDVLFEMDQETARFFYSNVQTFWDKTLSSFSGPEFSLSNGAQRFDLKMDADQNISSLQKMKINQIAFKQLLSFLSLEADRIEELGPQEKISPSSFLIQFKDHSFYFLSQGGELHVFSPELHLRYIYMISELPLSLQLMDYFR